MKAQELSRYIQTSWMFSAENTLEIPDIRTRIRFLDEREAQYLADLVQKRSVFARHSRENEFYVQRIKACSNKTIIEVLRPGDPDEMMAEAYKVADLTEKLALLSSTLAISRKKLHRQLVIKSHRHSVLSVTIGPGFRYLRSKSKPKPDVQGITIDKRFCGRFNRCGFPQLALLCTSRKKYC